MLSFKLLFSYVCALIYCNILVYSYSNYVLFCHSPEKLEDVNSHEDEEYSHAIGVGKCENS